MNPTRENDLQYRKEQILLDIMHDFIETACPVSSAELLRQHKYNLSSATIRNIMAELESADFLYQPHTSAGRIPTQKAYRFFVDKMELLGEAETNPAYRKLYRDLRGQIRVAAPDTPRFLAQHLAELSGSLAFAGILGMSQIYKAGLRRILDEPEFSNADNIRSFLNYTEQLEASIEQLCRNINGSVYISVGAQDAPFSTMAFTYRLRETQELGIAGLIGPMRMHYGRNAQLLDSIRILFEELYGER